MGLIIRKAEKRDLGAWAEMRERLWPHGLAMHRGELEEYFSSPGGIPGDVDQAWVAVDGSQFLGFVEASLRPCANGCDTRPVAFLEGIWVEEPARRSGLAGQLLQVVEQWAREKGILELGSDAEIENETSLRWHSASGFEERERVVCFRKKL